MVFIDLEGCKNHPEVETCVLFATPEYIME